MEHTVGVGGCRVMTKQEEQPGVDLVGTLHAFGMRHSVILLCEEGCVCAGPSTKAEPHDQRSRRAEEADR